MGAFQYLNTTVVSAIQSAVSALQSWSGLYWTMCRKDLGSAGGRAMEWWLGDGQVQRASREAWSDDNKSQRGGAWVGDLSLVGQQVI